MRILHRSAMVALVASSMTTACLAPSDTSPSDTSTVEGDGVANISTPLRTPSGVPTIPFYTRVEDPDALALTFDDGPDITGDTASILETLSREGVPATFFITSDTAVDVASSPTARALLRRMVAEGHHIGNHSAHHSDFAD